jgi:hypothetical protein
MIKRLIATFVSVVAAVVAVMAMASPASAATQTCRNVDYTTGQTWLRVCLTYTWSASGATYSVNELRAWNPGGQGASVVIGFLRQYDNSPYATLDKDFSLSDGQTAIIGDVGIQPSASKFQGVDHYGPGGVRNCLKINPGGNTNVSGSCAANGVG